MADEQQQQKEHQAHQPSSPSSDEPSYNPRLLRLTLLVHRAPHLTPAQFHAHWSTTHTAKVSAHLAKYGITAYHQYHTPSSLRSSLAKLLPPAMQRDDAIVDYDGFVELTMPNLECYERAVADEYYVDVVRKDEEGFVDWERSRVTVGWVEEYVVDGRVVKEEHREGREKEE